ncbi:sigma-70 family RNA polymerase sigma factor [Virgibacillus byunsanensis]|uniref:Sigma-70 family RNA polymerase sigma factor n=1 Tax=Virgibacillus byunsanensis TaxID=570945 RepID=A0ABW3LFQ7_9BACI
MNEESKMTFEEVFKQNEKRIHYHMYKLGINDPHREFYVEGLYAMWIAYKKYEPDKGPLATYFNFTIRNRLIDMLRKKTREGHHLERIAHEKVCKIDDGNRFGLSKLPVVDPSGITVEDDVFWDKVKSKLTENQWKWVQFYIIEKMPLGEIAHQESVTTDAVKSWGRQARMKLKDKAEYLRMLNK